VLTKSGREFMVGFGSDGVGISIDPPAIKDGLTTISYVDLTPDEADFLAGLLTQNAKQCRNITEKCLKSSLMLSQRLYVGARVAVKTKQLIPGRRKFPGRIGTIDRFISISNNTEGFWVVTLDATKNRKMRHEVFFYGVDLEVIL